MQNRPRRPADLRKFFKFTNEENLKVPSIQLEKAKLDIEYIQQILEKNNQFSLYALINWAEIYCNMENIDPKTLQTTLTKNLSDLTVKFDSGMTYVYLMLNFFGLLVALSKIPNLDFMSFFQDATLGNVAGSSWNYFDSLGGWAIGARQLMQGENKMGVANLLGGMQLSACTLVANIAKVSQDTAGNLMGFSFAAGMAIGCGIELYEAEKCERRISVYQEQLKKLEQKEQSTAENKSASNQEGAEQVTSEQGRSEQQPINKRELLAKSIVIERAKAENHKRNAKAWAGCAVAMSLIAFGVSTMGVGLAGTALIAGLAFVTGCIRKWWVGQVNYVEKAKQNLVQSAESQPDAKQSLSLSAESQSNKQNLAQTLDGKHSSKSLFHQLEDAILKNKKFIKFNEVVTIPGRLIFTSRKISLHAYLLELIVTNPEKVKNVIQILNQVADKLTIQKRLRIVLRGQQNYSLTISRGAALADELFSSEKTSMKPCLAACA